MNYIGINICLWSVKLSYGVIYVKLEPVRGYIRLESVEVRGDGMRSSNDVTPRVTCLQNRSDESLNNIYIGKVSLVLIQATLTVIIVIIDFIA